MTTSERASIDVAVLGRGPAGLMLARALVERGRRVVVVAPASGGPTPVYGGFVDELEAAGLAPFVARRYARPHVHVGEAALVLPRPYAWLDGDALGAAHAAALPFGALRVGRADAVDERGLDAIVALDDGTSLTARAVVDATGHAPRFVTRRDDHAPTAFQTAFGREIEGHLPGHTDDDMVFMDWSRRHDDGPPSFLYAMPTGDGGTFVEETALAARPAVSLELLERRLDARLAALGARPRAGRPVERCVIALDPALPATRSLVVPFGAALSLVHPATGYLVVRSALLTALVADTIVGALDDGAAARDVARRVVAVVWSGDRRRARALQSFAAEVLMGLDQRSLQRFFTSFFAAPVDVWSRFLAPEVRAPALATTMMALFAGADPASRRRMAGGLVAPRPRRALFGRRVGVGT